MVAHNGWSKKLNFYGRDWLVHEEYIENNKWFSKC